MGCVQRTVFILETVLKAKIHYEALEKWVAWREKTWRI